MKRVLLIIEGLRKDKKLYSGLSASLSHSYESAVFGYKSNRTVPEIVYDLREFLFQNHLLKDVYFSGGTFDVVTHSFGAVIFKNYVARYGEQGIGRVLLASPSDYSKEDFRGSFSVGLGRLGVLGCDYAKNEEVYLAANPKTLEVAVLDGQKTLSKKGGLFGFSRIFSNKARPFVLEKSIAEKEKEREEVGKFFRVEADRDVMTESPQFLTLAQNFFRVGSFLG